MKRSHCLTSFVAVPCEGQLCEKPVSGHRSLVSPLILLATMLTPCIGAEFVPLEFELNPNRTTPLSIFQMSENGRVISAREAGAPPRVQLWTAAEGAIDINRELRRETLSAQPWLARLSADGNLAVGTMSGGDPRPFIWSFETDTAEFTGSDNTTTSMSDDGSAVAGYFDRSPSGIYAWTQDNGLQVLAEPSDDNKYEPVLISGDGQVVVGSVVRGPFESFAGSKSELIRWVGNEATVLGEVYNRVLGGTPGIGTGRPRSISHDGSIIAGLGAADSSVGDEEVFRWTADDGIVGLGFEGDPHAMSSDGRVLAGGGGWSSLSPFGFPQDVPGFVWTEEGGATFYEDVTFADITAVGDVAVGREFEGRAVVWDSISGMRYLQDVLEQDSTLAADLEGWTLTQAIQISDDGLTISGRGTDPTGDDRSYWLISLDEPLVPQLIGDYDNDGQLSGNDIDQLALAIQSGAFDAVFDLNGDLSVDLQDHAFWISELANSFPGDANLDGKVEFDDFLVLSASFGNDGNWADGDFNASMAVDFADFLLLSANFGNSNELAASVPEPESTSVSLCLLSALAYRRRRTRRA